MKGQHHFSRNRHHPSPDLGLPALLPSQGGELRDRGANKRRSAGLPPRTEGCCPRSGREPVAAASPGPRPRPAQTRGRWCRGVGGGGTDLYASPSPGSAGRDVSLRGSLLLLYLLLYVPQQFLFDCVLRAAHGVAGGREATPSCPPSPPCALASSAPLRSAPHAQGGAPVRRAPRPPPPPPQPLPRAGLRSHLPSPAQTSGGWPGPFPLSGAGGGGCAQRRGGRGGGEAARARGRWAPGRAPSWPLSWQRARSRPEGANPHCELPQPVPRRTARGSWRALDPVAEGKSLASELASTQLDAP